MIKSHGTWRWSGVLFTVGLLLTSVSSQAQISQSLQTDKAPKVAAVPLEKVPSHGTFWMWLGPPVIHRRMAALLREGGAPVYKGEAKQTHFVIDDTQVDYVAIRQQQEEEKLLRNLAWDIGLLSNEEYGALGGDGPIVLYSYAAGYLWLEILSVTNAQANLIIHGTVSGQDYALLSKQALTNTAWVFEQIVTGAAGQDWTPAFAPVAERTNALFFWAVSLADADGDSLPDFWELEHGLNPSSAADANADPDGDGYTNLDEFLLGQDPHVSDPPRPTLTIAATDASAGEPSNSGTITLTRTGVTTRSLTAFYTVYGSARAGTDYQALPGQAIFAVGQSTAAITIQPVDDMSYEGAEDLTVQILPSVHYLNASNALATVTIADNEVQPLRVWAMPEEITEGGSPGVFAFMREGDLRSALTVNFTLTGTATNGVAYQTLPLAITFATNEFLTNLTVVPINNTNYSGTRIAQLTIVTNSAYQALTNVSSATLTIFDDEVPTVQVLADDVDAREGSPVRDGRFKFLRNATVNEPLEVTFAIHGTANPVYDYNALPTTITIPANTNAAYLTVHPVDDSTNELCETVIAVLRGSRSYKIGTTNSATVLIDDNEPVTFTWERIKATGVAGAANTSLSPAEFVVRRTGSTLTNVKHQIAVSLPGGALDNGMGFAWSGNVEIYAPPFQPASASEVRAVFDNRRSEARIQWNRNMTVFSGYPGTGQMWLYVPSLFTTNYHTFSFQEPDSLVSVNFLTNQVTEGATATLRFSRPTPSPFAPAYGPLVVPFKLEGVAAFASDYSLGAVPVTNISVTFGTAVYTVDLPLQATNDGVSEGWETAYVKLDSASLSYSPDTRAGQNWMTAINIRDVSVTGPLSPLDCDTDGIADAFERTYGTDPFGFNDPYVDTDGDGIPNLEESLTGMNPGLKDTDNDALDDYIEWTFGSNPTNAAQNTLLAPSEYASVKLAAASCYMCHQTTLNVGQYQLTSVPPLRGKTVDNTRHEQIFQFLKGASYPITISGPVTSVSTGQYTAEILVPSNSVPPEFFLEDPDDMLGEGRPVSELPGKVAHLIVPKLELTWTNKGDNLALDVNTNGYNDVVQGIRIFVGAKTQSENVPRNTVLLKIKTTPPLVGSNVWVKAFDVDDTTDDKRLDNKNIIDPNGRAGGDNYVHQVFPPQYGVPGLFAGNNSSSYTATLDAQGEALVEFRVSLQPGDNYRIAATVFPQNNLNTLQVADPNGGGFVSAYEDKIVGGFNGALSSLLTVWRKLHLEIDSMTAIPTNGPQKNFQSVKIMAVKPNHGNPGQTAVYYQKSLYSELIPTNQYQNGTLRIPGLGTTNLALIGQGYDYAVQFNKYFNYVIVQGAIPTNAAGLAGELRDDDERWVSSLGLPTLPMDGFSQQILNGYQPSMSPKPISGVASAYAPAFIEVADANQLGWNTRRTVPFFLNKDALDGLSANVFGASMDLSDKVVFWAHTVTFGYQPLLEDDGDPNTESADLGITPESVLGFTAYGYSAIYLESIADHAVEQREGGADVYVKQRAFYGWLFGTVAHEVGHPPGKNYSGTDHDEDQLMMAGASPIKGDVSFSPKSLRRFRQSSSWTGGLP